MIRRCNPSERAAKRCRFLLRESAYDIQDNSRRLKVAKALLDFGDRVQYSVFECILDGDLLEKMMKRLNRIVKVEEDSIRIYGLCKGCEASVKVIGAGKVSKDENVYIL